MKNKLLQTRVDHKLPAQQAQHISPILPLNPISYPNMCVHFLPRTNHRDKKTWLSAAVFPSPPSVCSRVAPLGVAAAAPCHPPVCLSTRPLKLTEAKVSIWGHLSGTFPQVARQLSPQHRTHHFSHIKWPFVFFLLAVSRVFSHQPSPNFRSLAAQHLQNIRGAFKQSIWQKPGSLSSKQQCLFSCLFPSSWLLSDAFVFQVVEAAEGKPHAETNTTHPPLIPLLSTSTFSTAPSVNGPHGCGIHNRNWLLSPELLRNQDHLKVNELTDGI